MKPVTLLLEKLNWSWSTIKGVYVYQINPNIIMDYEAIEGVTTFEELERRTNKIINEYKKLKKTEAKRAKNDDPA